MTGSVPIRRVSVVVPARNEAASVGRCLRSIHAARARLFDETGPDAPAVSVLVVADRCHDDTEQIALDHGSITIRTTVGAAGAARHAGVVAALGAPPTVPPAQHWIANTDADSAVPADWLLTQYRNASAGARVVAGLVTPDPSELTDADLLRWSVMQPARRGHRHVYGANLGVRADLYLRVGGFPLVSTGEDQSLVDAARAAGAAVIATDESIVVTSARRHSRAPGGFAGWLEQHLLAPRTDPAGPPSRPRYCADVTRYTS